MTPDAVVAATTRRWRLICLGAGVLAVCLTVVAVALPWFERTSSGDVDTYTPWLWGGPHEQVPGYPSTTANLIALAVSRQWGLSLVIASSVGALLGLYAAAQDPGDPRIRKAVVVNVVAAALSLVLTVLAWFGFDADGGADTVTSPAIGVVLALPGQVAWLVLAVLAMRIAARARGRTALSTPVPPSGVR